MNKLTGKRNNLASRSELPSFPARYQKVEENMKDYGVIALATAAGTVIAGIPGLLAGGFGALVLLGSRRSR